jgi:glycosyl transferase family 61
MKSFKRRVYDAYAAAATTLSGPPAEAKEPVSGEGIEVIHLASQGSVRLEHSLEARFHGLPESFSVLSWPETCLYRLNNVKVVGDQGNVFLNDGRWLRVCPSLDSLEGRKVRRPLPFYSRQIHPPAFHLTGRDHENHGHFLFQHLPRLLACRDLPQLPKKLKLLVAQGHQRWQARYLQKLGLDDTTDIIECDEGTLCCDELFYAPQIRSQSSPLCRPQDYVHMRECFHRPSPKTGLPVFISRADAPDRHLLNETEVIASFERTFGSCRVVRLSQTPLDEQIDLISRAPLITGSQGQAFAVSLFAKDSVFVILEAGEHNPWCDSFRDVAIICDNQALTLYSGTPRQTNESYTFPVGKLEHAWEQLKQLLQGRATLNQ